MADIKLRIYDPSDASRHGTVKIIAGQLVNPGYRRFYLFFLTQSKKYSLFLKVVKPIIVR